MRRSLLVTCAACAGMLAGSTGSVLARTGPENVVREGTGERRVKLDKMELAPFPSDAWNTLSDWAGGKAISSADTNGQVVLICTFSDWYKPANRAWDLAQKLATNHAKKGLVVVGAFSPEGWSEYKKPEAAKPGEKDGPRVLIAHDAKGDFRKAILSDQDPDFYVIDRSGQLRFADITTESVSEAVNICLGETMESAAGTKGALADAAAKADAQGRRIEAIRSEVDLKSLPELPFAEPTADAYEKVKNWPRKDLDPEKRDNGENVVKTLTLPPAGAYYKKDPLYKGRAIVVYVWSPDLRRSYEKIMPMMDLIQRQRGRDIAVIGAMTRIEERDDRNKPKEQTPPVDLVRKFVDEQGIEHSQTVYNDGMIGAVDRNGDQWLPYAIVASSNGTIRWEGNPNRAGFVAAIEQVLTVDPGVKARREAEESYLKKQKK